MDGALFVAANGESVASEVERLEAGFPRWRFNKQASVGHRVCVAHRFQQRDR